ncbi:Huntingtin-interacting protein 1 [Blattella germanica]|nr:Huntingtin-interacting protein 1 [Blattella germanica]
MGVPNLIRVDVDVSDVSNATLMTQSISIGKAINQLETPVKEKHVRSTIIGTFHEKGAHTFWLCALRLPLQDNRIVAWKFCHVLHKVLREGHPVVLSHSQRHRSAIEDLGKLWCHLREGYGKLIQCYTNLLITKLDFHRRNPRFPGNLQVTKEELESIGLPPDTLSGHRERFLKQFQDLRQFYLNANTMQYFRNLIQIPLLPENPPNFLVQSDLRSYVTPVVILPPEEIQQGDESVTDGNLVDTSDTNSTTGDLVDLNHRNGSISPDVLAERDNLIEHLQQEISRLRTEIQRLIHEHQRIVDQLNEKIGELQVDLATKDSELLQERQLKEDLLQQTEAVSKFQETEKETLQKSSNEAQAELMSLRASQDAAKNENQNLACKVEWLLNEKSSVESDLQDLLAQKEDLDVRLKNTEKQMKELEERLQQEKFYKLHQLLDYFRGLTEPVRNSLTKLGSSFESYHSDPTSIDGLVQDVTCMAHLVSNYLLQGKTTSNTSPDIEFGERIAEVCKLLGTTDLTLLASIKDRNKAAEVAGNIIKVQEKVSEVADLIEKLTNALKGDSAERIGDLVESELASMDKAIEEAAKRIETAALYTILLLPDFILKNPTKYLVSSIIRLKRLAIYFSKEMLSKSRAADSGLKLEVNEKILDSCTNLMQAIRVLVQKSRLLQAEIVAQGKGTASAKEFYKRNHQWTEGLISAAKSVGMGAKYLLTAADKVVSGQGKFEHLVVASQEIAASTAQLVVASRVKADRNSKNMSALSQASKEDLDMSGLSLHQAKRLEMESQVKVLELEASLDQERLRLAALRRHHYQLAGEGEGWEQEDLQNNK